MVRVLLVDVPVRLLVTAFVFVVPVVPLVPLAAVFFFGAEMAFCALAGNVMANIAIKATSQAINAGRRYL